MRPLLPAFLPLGRALVVPLARPRPRAGGEDGGEIASSSGN